MTKESSHELRTLVDDCEKRVSSLEFHKLKMDGMAEVIVITLLTTKLDSETRKCWESTIEHGKMPTYKDTVAFLRKRSYALERCEQMSGTLKNRTGNEKLKSTVMSSKVHSVVVQKSDESCPVCELSHTVERHHSLMHPEERKLVPSNPSQATANMNGRSNEGPLTAAKCMIPNQPCETTKHVLLATAVVGVEDVTGVIHQCRALLDSGAMANFLSERVADVLRLPKSSVNIPVIGVNGMKSGAKFKVQAAVRSMATDIGFNLDYLIVPKITGALPAKRIDVSSWPIPKNLVLADRFFNEPSRIDMLIGAEVFFELLQAGKIRMSSDLPLLHESVLGWLVAGPVTEVVPVNAGLSNNIQSSLESGENLHELLKRFWIIEEQVLDAESSSLIDDCEKHFMQTHTRTEDGRYVVMLPFRDNVCDLGESRRQAERRFYSLEKRLAKNPELKQMYDNFIDEYLALGHCVEIDCTGSEVVECGYFLPHHCVVKPDSSSTKLRVVFDASAKSESGLSLNDVMNVGPTVQSSLFDITLRFRTFKYTFSAGVPKMYRYNTGKIQRILFRKSGSEPLKEIEFKTVTYGTSAAPFLATRSLNQLAGDESDAFPKASAAVKKSFYIDDILTGANTLDEAVSLQKDLIALLLRGGFDLHKWCANHPRLLEGIPTEAQEKQMHFEDSAINGVIKTLGLRKPTKRQVLSETAKIFDPLGLLAPTVVIPKLLMQHLWKDKQEWDEQIPDELQHIWNRFRSELPQIGTEKIDRRVTTDDAVKLQLHGFADASGVAYGCCVYMRNVKL
ncbi:uncharacterized protein LOC134221424 [Armigeres subalbatus]|uniref:uncharacterized protein LOC134221424 n=1 Tax=Armigeres subalbatus TaxID=124917 RepID=UPI002ED31F59